MKPWKKIVNIIRYIWLTFKQIYRAVFKIFEIAFKIENCSKFIMEMMLTKRLFLEIKKTQTNKTFMALKYNFNTHFGVIWSNSLK